MLRPEAVVASQLAKSNKGVLMAILVLVDETVGMLLDSVEGSIDSYSNRREVIDIALGGSSWLWYYRTNSSKWMLYDG